MKAFLNNRWDDAEFPSKSKYAITSVKIEKRSSYYDDWKKMHQDNVDLLTRALNNKKNTNLQMVCQQASNSMRTYNGDKGKSDCIYISVIIKKELYKFD